MQRKAEQKKVSACCPESGISDTLKESSAAGECRGVPERPVLLPDFAKTRENAHKKRTAAGLEILEALKRMVSPDQGGIWTDRAGWMLNCCKKWHKKRMPAEWGALAAGSLNRAKVCSKKRRYRADRRSILTFLTP